MIYREAINVQGLLGEKINLNDRLEGAKEPRSYSETPCD